MIRAEPTPTPVANPLELTVAIAVLVGGVIGSTAKAAAVWAISNGITSRPGSILVFMGLPECSSDALPTIREMFSRLHPSGIIPARTC